MDCVSYTVYVYTYISYIACLHVWLSFRFLLVLPKQTMLVIVIIVVDQLALEWKMY